MADRYFVETPIEGGLAHLTGAEAHHLAHVMRAKPGDEAALFDGSGAEFTARVERVGRAEVELSVLARVQVDREMRVAVTLGVALPKQDRGRWLVEKGVELGVARLVPLVAQHGADRASAAALDRMRRTVIEASKQCGRNRLMEVCPAQDVADYLAAAPPEGVRLLAHPGGSNFRSVILELVTSGAPRGVWLAIGPEGGFSEAEVEQAARSGWRLVGFGPRILRVETAALALAAAVAVAIEAE